MPRLRQARAASIVGLVAAMPAGCAPGHPVSAAPASRAAAKDPSAVAWHYDVRADGGDQRSLIVQAEFAAGGGDTLEIDDDGAPFVRGLMVASGANWVAAPGAGPSWNVPCQVSGCRIQYRFALGEAADRLHSVEGAIASGTVISSPPSTWLLHTDTDTGRFRLHVSVDPPSRFAIAIPPSPDGASSTFEAPVDALEGAGFAVFGPFHTDTVQSGAARVDVVIAPHDLTLSDPEVVAWVRTAVEGLAAYYGRFHPPRTLVVVQAGQPGSPTRGETLGDGGPAVLVRVGADVTAAKTREDWVVTHELIHVTQPSLARDHSWLSEGLATYVEPIVRARAGLVTPEAYWHDLIEGVPQGLPEPGDEGLDRTHTWGRTYWGGALFCLVADVRIREQTNNTRSLDDALRGIVATGADVEAHWTIEQFLDAGDRATGTSVLRDLYQTMALAPGSVDLPALWKRLGVRVVERGRASFDDSAPLASIRQSITRAR
jgi:hypothetical protein